jgi:hypothetical protein
MRFSASNTPIEGWLVRWQYTLFVVMQMLVFDYKLLAVAHLYYTIYYAGIIILLYTIIIIIIKLYIL